MPPGRVNAPEVSSGAFRPGNKLPVSEVLRTDRPADGREQIQTRKRKRKQAGDYFVLRPIILSCVPWTVGEVKNERSLPDG